MKTKVKSSITLPPQEFALIKKLKQRLGAKSNVEVIRRSLRLLQESEDRAALREAFQKAAVQLRGSVEEEVTELDHLSSEGVE